ncbi:hypothetical protein [Tolypothrix sp. VBCCA 56010]|uniref:hypothetical protein n=1 Tax=Tolypothrix sp. VBCCA 56010 TaxID=3137731 RepID=UPI003D7C68A1
MASLLHSAQTQSPSMQGTGSHPIDQKTVPWRSWIDPDDAVLPGIEQEWLVVPVLLAGMLQLISCT